MDIQWIPIEDSIPPHGVWVYTTRLLGDGAYEAGPRSFYDIDIYEHMKDVGFTHWRLASGQT